jgi:hypothetical protein
MSREDDRQKTAITIQAVPADQVVHNNLLLPRLNIEATNDDSDSLLSLSRISSTVDNPDGTCPLEIVAKSTPGLGVNASDHEEQVLSQIPDNVVAQKRRERHRPTDTANNDVVIELLAGNPDDPDDHNNMDNELLIRLQKISQKLTTKNIFDNATTDEEIIKILLDHFKKKNTKHNVNPDTTAQEPKNPTRYTEKQRTEFKLAFQEVHKNLNFTKEGDSISINYKNRSCAKLTQSRSEKKLIIEYISGSLEAMVFTAITAKPLLGNSARISIKVTASDNPDYKKLAKLYTMLHHYNTSEPNIIWLNEQGQQLTPTDNQTFTTKLKNNHEFQETSKNIQAQLTKIKKKYSPANQADPENPENQADPEKPAGQAEPEKPATESLNTPRTTPGP